MNTVTPRKIYTTVLAKEFPDQSESFHNGFAAGRIWQQVRDGYDLVEGGVNPSCQATVELIAGHVGAAVEFSDGGPGSLHVVLIPEKDAAR